MGRKKVKRVKKKTGMNKRQKGTRSKRTMAKKAATRRKKKVSAIPKGYQTITPYLIIDGAAKAIDFYKKAFKAKEVMRMESPDGKIRHAELKIYGEKIMLSDEHPDMGMRSPNNVGGSPVSIHLYVKDVDTIFDLAVKTGALVLRPIENMFYGDRSGTLEDPFGHKWHVSTHIEDVTLAKMKKRAKTLFDKS